MMSELPLKSDAPFYTEDELDALYARDPVLAMRISREQSQLQKQLEAMRAADPEAPLPSVADLDEVLKEARSILLRDGGDLELVALEGTVVRVRLKGNCVGCPRATLDLKNVVEALVRKRYPRITEVRNTF
ncbi:MAG: NifU family protein [Burkholderiales bacterium]|nr:NifU family protein [Burkholderiales bacterium]